MKYVEDIGSLLKTLLASNRFHCLIIEGPPGWGKSTTINRLLQEQKVRFYPLGAYITPFELFRTLREEPTAVHVIDDSEGIFNSLSAVSILRAATWSSAGSNIERNVSWKSSASGPECSFTFCGKLILLTNSTTAMAAKGGLLSRSLHFSIRLDTASKINAIAQAAKDSKSFPDIDAATAVARFLSKRLRAGNNGVNLRTLELGYELRTRSPETWIQTLETLTPLEPTELVERLQGSGMTVENQAQEFCRVTGLCRRTFYNYRRSVFSL